MPGRMTISPSLQGIIHANATDKICVNNISSWLISKRNKKTTTTLVAQPSEPQLTPQRVMQSTNENCHSGSDVFYSPIGRYSCFISMCVRLVPNWYYASAKADYSTLSVDQGSPQGFKFSGAQAST